jgi:hypothetical protein
MKTKEFSIGITFLVLLLCTACTKDEVLPAPDGESSALKSAKVKIVADITIEPSGDLSGVSDADNIQSALDNLVADGTILLESGTFYINREIYVSDFSGTLTGSGKDKTEIMGVGDNITPFTSGTFFFFDQPSGALTVSNLSLTLPDGFSTNIGDLGNFAVVILTSDGSDTHFDNLSLTGTDEIGNNAYLVSQPINGIVVQGDYTIYPSFTSGGFHTVTNSHFSKIAIQATQHQGFKNASIEVSGNSYSEIKQTIYRHLEGCNVNIHNNVMDTYSFGAIVVTQEGLLVPGDPNSVVIRSNNVTTRGFMPIEIGAIPDGGASYMLLIEKNKLTNSGPDPIGAYPNFTGIGIFDGNNDAVVRNNIIRGEAEYGIYQESNGGTFVGNNLQGFNAYVADYGLFGNDNTVVGKGNSTVADGGTDNIITGLTKVAGQSIGDRIKEAQAKRKEILESAGSH